ncbi:MAG: cyclic lactone autoinducer peptide [Lachnospiraceae bacterium]|nr:cyclic lactone autoinducer peptide [Lachnospiraceae bacterium]
MKKINRLIGKIVYSTALKAAEKEVNSACTTKFYQEKLDSQTDILKKYHDKKNS